MVRNYLSFAVVNLDKGELVFTVFSSQLVDPLENNPEIILHIAEKETL